MRLFKNHIQFTYHHLLYLYKGIQLVATDKIKHNKIIAVSNKLLISSHIISIRQLIKFKTIPHSSIN